MFKNIFILLLVAGVLGAGALFYTSHRGGNKEIDKLKMLAAAQERFYKNTAGYAKNFIQLGLHAATAKTSTDKKLTFDRFAITLTHATPSRYSAALTYLPVENIPVTQNEVEFHVYGIAGKGSRVICGVRKTGAKEADATGDALCRQFGGIYSGGSYTPPGGKPLFEYLIYKTK